MYDSLLPVDGSGPPEGNAGTLRSRSIFRSYKKISTGFTPDK